MNIEERVDMLESKHDSHKYASRGQGNAGVALGSVGTALGALGVLGNGGLGGLLGGGCGCKSGEDHPVSRYDLGHVQELQNKDMEIARLNTELKLRDSNIYTDQKSLELYRYVDGRFREFEAAIASQAVINQATKDSVQIVQERLDCAKGDLHDAIKRECEARKCADNTIVNYVNATFYPKMVADITTGTTTTAQSVYNPLPISTCGCGCGCN
jgi:hypothetical protein